MNIILVIILFLLLFNIKKKEIIDFFTNVDDINEKKNKIIYNVIHLKNSPKYSNILHMEEMLNKKINIFDAIDGRKLDINNLTVFDPNISLNWKYEYSGEVGIYLSHLMLIKQAALDTENDYTVIFEDDFKLNIDDFDKKINNIINKINGDFDIIFLGTLNWNHGTKIIDEIHEIDKSNQVLGCHGLLINNKSANKMLSYLTYLSQPIDHKFHYLICNDHINAKIIHPPIVDQNQKEFDSEIRPVVWSKM